MANQTTVQPFTIKVEQDVLDDLNARLKRTRWADEVEGADWDYGVNRSYLQEFAAYWRDSYDWRAHEAMLNQFPQFRADFDGYGLHFIHVRGKGTNPKPLLLLHGWPDSFYRFYKLIPMLTDPASFGGDPANSYDVIVPSLPGFGFSDKPRTREGVDPGDLLMRLMTDVLGYTRFGVLGGDTGSPLAREIATRFPENVMGIYLTDIGYDATIGLDPETLSDAEKAFVGQVEQWSFMQGAYVSVQMTMPQTLAYGMTDSPVGMAAWILQHFRAWSDSNGNLENSFTKDELLTNIMIYWVTDTFNSSIRWYFAGGSGWDADGGGEWGEASGAGDGADAAGEWGAGSAENGMEDWMAMSKARVEVPVGVGLFPKEIPGNPPPRELAERTLNVQHWTTMPRGGHFAALETPELLADDLRAFFSSIS